MSEPASESFSCLHDLLFDSGLHKIMASPPNRRLIWWLCMSNLQCMTCHKRLTPQFSQEDARNAQTRRANSRKVS